MNLASPLLQILGALLIARLAVNWALKRYKAEKLWDRRLAAYSELTSALANWMHTTRRLHEQLTREPTKYENFAVEEKKTARLFADAGNARASLAEATIVAKLVLPLQHTQTIIDRIKEKAQNDGILTYEEKIIEEHEVGKELLHDLVEKARANLSIDDFDH